MEKGLLHLLTKFEPRCKESKVMVEKHEPKDKKRYARLQLFHKAV